ncbi:hypothetical protein OC842_004285 [Tilletia horrida]|uniref:PARP catalytic domain-containing protein n=1 Tax=Tilletia horrida TaxID=155126 RepID=A0AAN6G9N8_9BASI|nr:hypothetical protein OC842_004285 [Tilletia horrida]
MASCFASDPWECVLCSKAVSTLSAICHSCANTAQRSAPGLISLHRRSPTFQRVEADFLRSWAHQTAISRPTVTGVQAVLVPQKVMKRYERVRRRSESPKETRLYHGTTVACGFNGYVCSHPSCSLCGIIANGFRHPKPSSAASLNLGAWDRFGSAIYTTPVSSKAADYENLRNGYPFGQGRTRHIIVARVATGRMQTLHKEDPHRRYASRGFDSIICPPGVSVNHTEHVSYKDTAAVPLFM